MFHHNRRLACLFVLLFLVVACLIIYILNDRQVHHVHQLDGARFQKSYNNNNSSSSGTPIVQTFNYLPWTSLGKQKQNDAVKVKVKPVLSPATLTTITPLFELELELESSSSSLIKGTDVPFVVLSGPSVFSVDNITTVTTNQSSNYYRLVFPERMDSGTYEMHIIFYMDKTPYAIPGSPFPVVVQDDDKYDMAAIMKDDDDNDDDDTPYCNAAFTSSQVPGRWIRATPKELASGTSPRDGWIWKPFECQFYMQPTRTLPCGEPLWVAVFGTSTIRGVFFELLDTILPERQSDSSSTIASVAWWKCWGYLDASVQNFRFSYRDLRLHYPESRLSPGYKDLALHWLYQNVCPRRLNGTAAAWANTTRDQWSQIDVIVAESDDLLRSVVPGCVEEFEAAGGTFMGVSLKPRSASLNNLATGRLVSQQHEEQGRPFLDVAPMARPMYNNGRKTGMATDVHYVHNGFCRFNRRTKHICSGVVEMEVFAILHTIRQLRPSWAKSLDAATVHNKCVAAVANKPELDSEEPGTALKQQQQHNDGVVLQPTICMQCPLNFGYLDTQPIQCTEGIPLECLGHRRKKHWWQTFWGTGGKACFSNT